MNKLLLLIGLVFMLIACTQKSDSQKSVSEMVVGQCLKMEWGQCMLKEKEGNTYLAVEVNDWPKTGMLNISGLKLKVNDIYLESQPNHHFAWRFYEGNLQIHVSSLKSDNTSKVLLVKTKGKVLFANTNPNND